MEDKIPSSPRVWIYVIQANHAELTLLARWSVEAEMTDFHGHIQKGLMLGLVLCHIHLEILNF